MKIVHRDLVRNGPGSVKVLLPLAPPLVLSVRALRLLVGFALFWGLGLGLTQPLGFSGLLYCF